MLDVVGGLSASLEESTPVSCESGTRFDDEELAVLEEAVDVVKEPRAELELLMLLLFTAPPPLTSGFDSFCWPCESIITECVDEAVLGDVGVCPPLAEARV